MRIVPILTEKSLKLAEEQKYSFWVPTGFTKYKIKRAVSEEFGVEVAWVKTAGYKKRVKRNFKREKTVKKARKRAIVKVVGDKKIEAFSAKT